MLDATHAEPITGKGSGCHHHAEMELTTFTAGEGVFFVGDHIGPFAAGEVVLLGENLPHYWHARGPCAGFSVQWNFPPGHPFWAFPEALPLLELSKNAGQGIRFRGRSGETLRAGLGQIGFATGLERLSLLLGLLAVMARGPAAERVLLSRRSFSLPAASIHQQAIDQALRYLLANFRNAIRLQDVLLLTRMSKPTFSRQFKQLSGKTFSELVSQLRLQSACCELLESARPILEVALSCGFTEVSFFNRLFRRRMGCSPSQYRTRMAPSTRAQGRVPL